MKTKARSEITPDLGVYIVKYVLHTKCLFDVFDSEQEARQMQNELKNKGAHVDNIIEQVQIDKDGVMATLKGLSRWTRSTSITKTA